jgi:NAD(P)-dependent dehydrogenase (short-subunit alcohol dehydrogenase family)
MTRSTQGRLDGKVAVLTGGAGDIGRAVAARFAAEGADIVIAGLDEPHQDLIAGIVGESGRRCLFCRADVTSAAANESVMQRAVDEFGRIDVLLTAAGIPRRGYRATALTDDEVTRKKSVLTDPAKAFMNASLADWTAVLDVNLTGTLLAVQAAARRMAPGGSIITVASVAAKQPGGDAPGYSVSKAGVWMLTKFAAQALAGPGLRVNCIAPGFLATNQTAAMRAIPELAAATLARVPMRRFGTADEIAGTALFLAGAESSYTTGEIFHVDGGFYTE